MIEIPIGDDQTLHIVLEMSIGDLLVSSLLSGIGFFMLLTNIIKILWRR